jgi:hypothetical protein
MRSGMRFLLHVLTKDMDSEVYQQPDGSYVAISADGNMLCSVKTMEEFIEWAREYNKKLLARGES